MYVDAFGAGKPASGAFFVYDLVTEVGSRVRQPAVAAHDYVLTHARGIGLVQVPAEFSQSLGLAIRHQEPVRISCAAILATTADCLQRMEHACAQDAECAALEGAGAVGALASRWTEAQSSFGGPQPASAMPDGALLSLLSDLRQLHAKNTELFTRL